jgi:thiol-disulfide isomerase/thioredoxin
LSTAWVVAYFVLAGAVVTLALLVLGSMRRIAFVLERAESRLSAGTSVSPGGLAPGAPVPAAAALRADGSPFDTGELAGRRTIVLFLSSSCAPCKGLARELEREKELDTLPAELVVVVPDAEAAETLGLERIPVVFQPDHALARAFDTTTTPHGFLVDASKTVVASATPNTLRDLRRLAGQHRANEGSVQNGRPVEADATPVKGGE